MTDPVRVGVLGCGRIAQMFHLRALTALPAARLVALADADPRLLAQAGAVAPGAARFDDYVALLEEPDLDAVVICLPSNLHAVAAEAAFARGRGVYVEKPLAATLADGRRILDAWNVSGQVGRVGFNLRFHPVYQDLRRALADGRVGAPVAVRTAMCSAPRDLPAWKRARASGGGALLDLASHHVDLVRHLLDAPVEQVGAQLRSVRTEDDTAVIDLRLADGVPVQILATITAPQEDRIEVYGDGGKLVADRFRSRTLAFVPVGEPTSRGERLRRAATAARRAVADVRDIGLPRPEPSFAAALAAFVAAAGGQRADGPTIADGYASLQVIDAAERAAHRGQPVLLTDEAA